MSFEKLPRATAVFDDSTPLDISEGSVTLDTGKAPYCLADLEVPLLDESILEDLDPYANQRVVITASANGFWGEGGSPIPGEDLYPADDLYPEIVPAWEPSDEREFDLVLTGRTVSHDRRSVSLDLASDEAILQRFSDVTDDPTPRSHEASLRSLVSYVITKAIPGATLEPGPDADVTAQWAVTNMLANPSGEADAAGVAPSNWTIGQFGSGLVTVTMGSPIAVSGTRAVGWTTVAGGDSNIIPVNASTGARTFSVTPGKWYVWSYYVCSTAARTARAAIQWWSAGGTVLSSQVFGTTVATTNTAFQRACVIAQAPEGTTHAYPYVNIANAAATNVYVDAAMFYEGDELVPYFDGSSTLPGYTVAWSNVAHASTSTRTPIVERSPALFLWEAGVSAWEFLAPLVAMSGLRLWCDEKRRWRLLDPALYSVPGRVVAQVSNTSRGDDSIDSLSPQYSTGVVLVYTWSENGVNLRRVDAAGTGPYVLREEINKPFPGPGRAAARLLKLQGQGRTQEVTIGADYTVSPAMEIGIRLPGTFDQLGTLTKVTWQLKRGLMDLGSAGLASTIPGTIDALSGTIDGLTGTIDSL